MGKNTRSAFVNYLGGGILCCLSSVAAYFFNQPVEMIAFKAFIAPIFWLALMGLEGIFRYPVYEGRFTLRALEYSALKAFLWMAFGLFVAWNAQPMEVSSLVGLPVLFIVFTALIMGLGVWRSAA